MKLYLKSPCLLLLFLSLCIKVSSQNVIRTTDILVINSEDAVPEGAKKVAKLKVTDAGFALLRSFEETLAQAKIKALKEGGNIIKITQLKPPDLLSTNFRLFGDVYFHPDLDAIKTERKKAFDSTMKARFPDMAAYALLYIYRPDAEAPIPYKVSLNDSVIYRSKDSSRLIVKINKTGPAKISARKAEAHAEIWVNLEPGKPYFIKCTILPGGLMGRPELTNIEPSKGFEEFYLLKDKPKQKPEKSYDDVY